MVRFFAPPPATWRTPSESRFGQRPTRSDPTPYCFKNRTIRGLAS
nr:MAG TPA: hypothetical protein [Inoviridae sp.]